MTTWFRDTKWLFLAVALAAGAEAWAQNWPTKAVTVIVPWPPGGPSDIAARPIAKGLNEALGKPFVIDWFGSYVRGE